MKLLIFLILMCVAFVTDAQTFGHTTSNPTGAILNASVDTMTLTLNQPYAIVAIQPVVTKATGTAAGWSVLDYSVNGILYRLGSDTIALTNVTSNTGIWVKQIPARYWRIRTGGATTVTATTSARISVK